MILGSSIYQIQLLQLQDRKRLVGQDLVRTQKDIARIGKALTTNKRLFIQQNLPNKAEYINNYIAQYFDALGDTSAAEELKNDANTMSRLRMEAMAQYSEEQAMINETAEEMFEEDSNQEMQAAKYKEEDLTCENAELDSRIPIVEKLVEWAREQMKKALDFFFPR